VSPLVAHQTDVLNQLSAQVPPFVPTPPGQPAYVAPTPQAPAPWTGATEDEAQAAPSANTSWADLQAKLLPQIAVASTENQAAAQQADPVSS
jgi:hypothetical protein